MSDWIKDFLEEKRDLTTQDLILYILVAVALAGLVGFGQGYSTADYPAYMAEYNDFVIYKGLDGGYYKIQMYENRDLILSTNYTYPDGYLMHRLVQMI